jgi:hypothetical protein
MRIGRREPMDEATRRALWEMTERLIAGFVSPVFCRGHPLMRATIHRERCLSGSTECIINVGPLPMTVLNGKRTSSQAAHGRRGSRIMN